MYDHNCLEGNHMALMCARLSEIAGALEQRSEGKRVLRQCKNIAILLWMEKCCTLCIFDTLLIHDIIDFFHFYFRLLGKFWSTWVNALTTPWISQVPCERPIFPVRGPASLWEVLPTYERLSPSMRGPASLWGAQPLCKRPSYSVRIPASLWEAQAPFERPSLPLRGLASHWKA